MRLDCECGFVARGAGGDEVVAVAQAHARAHLVDLTPEVILALADLSREGEGGPDDAQESSPACCETLAARHLGSRVKEG